VTPRHLAVLAALALTALPAAAAPLESLEVRAGRCELVLPSDQAGDQFLLIVGSLAPSGGLCHVRIEANPTVDAVALPLATTAADAAWRQRVRGLADRQDRARQRDAAEEARPPLKPPPSHKVFYVPTRNHGLDDPAAYAAVHAELQGTGKHCQVYLDQDHADAGALRLVVEDVLRTFDEDIFPRAPGRALDVDRDGRFTVLLTGRVAALAAGPVKLSGFVRGSDFYRDLPAPFGNQCDLMYLSTAVRPGPFLRTLLAHEYTHGVVFSEHVFGDYLPGASRRDEEGWLSEALSHLVEDGHGYSWDNLDYRVSAFLNDPGRYSLALPDDAYAKVWRDPGTRGAGYLFLRWCADRFGPELLTRLVRSNLRGVDNLEAATQTPFAELSREWSAALAVSGREWEVEGVTPLRGVGLCSTLGSRLLAGPRFEEVAMDGGTAEVKLAATAAVPVLLHSPLGPRSRVVVTAEPGAALQVSLLRLPPPLPRLALAIGDQSRLTLTAHGGVVHLRAMAWERLVTCDEPEGDTSYHAGAEAPAWFGTAPLKAGEARTSAPLALPGGPVVVRVIGVDDQGRTVTAWALAGGGQKCQENR
jgi:hypothetical protein